MPAKTEIIIPNTCQALANRLNDVDRECQLARRVTLWSPKNAMSFVCMLSNMQTAASFLIAVNCDVLQCMLLRAMVPMVGHASRPALQLHLLAQHITIQKKKSY